MTFTGGRKIGRLRAAALILSGIFAVCVFSPDGRMFCEAKEAGTKQAKAVDADKGQKITAEEDATQEVIDFVTAYYEAQTPEGIDTLTDYVDDPQSEDFQVELLRYRAMFRLRNKGWSNIRVVACPMSDGKHWVASVSSDRISGSYEFGIPNIDMVLVERNEEGALKIVLDGEKALPDALIKEARELSLSDEIVEHSNEITTAYNALLTEHPELVELLESEHYVVEEELDRMLEAQFPVQVKADAREKKASAAKQAKAADADKGQKTTAEEDAAQEIIDFISAYYEAQTPEGIDTLADYVDDPLSEDFQRDLLRQQIMFREGGIQGWENIKVIVLPMSDGKHWIVSVSSDLRVEAFDVGIPGLRVELVGRNEEGALKIVKYDDSESSDAFLKEVRELALSDEFVEHSNEAAMAYNELIAERSDIMEWVLETNEAVDREMGKALAREEAFLAKADTEKDNQSAGKIGSYTVQKGDCLWDIAEEQLGDGMRWSGLYEQNKDVIGEDPNLLYVGITLQLN